MLLLWVVNLKNWSEIINVYVIVTHICIVSCEIEWSDIQNVYVIVTHIELWVVKLKSWSDIQNVYVNVTHAFIVSCKFEKLKRNHKCLCNCYTYLYWELWNRKAEAKSQMFM
jgi:hypothetical protein